MTAPLDIHFIAIGGTGMAPLACLLKELGHHIRGSDGPLYPPMSTLLERAGIEPATGFDPAHLEPVPDLVIVGNAVPRTNPEAVAAEERGLELASMPEAISRFVLEGRRPLVVAGTHGKTTSSSMAAWTLLQCGHDPGYLIGGLPQNLTRSFHLGAGARFVIEGDEYNASYFDRGPKFLHYRPETVILTSVEYDHADLYPDAESLLEAYRSLVDLIPPNGLLVACGDSEQVREVASRASCRVLLYGLESHNHVRPVRRPDFEADGTFCSVRDWEVDGIDLELRVPGKHNLTNALGVWTAARRGGHSPQNVASALGAFAGVRRRLEELGNPRGITVVDDFAHHPTAIRETIAALRQKYPQRRLLIAFEPRSLTAGRIIFQAAYEDAFGRADRLLLAPVFHAERFRPEECLDRDRLADALRARGVATDVFDSVDELFNWLLASLHEGDVIATMSSGDFQSLAQRLTVALRSG